MNLINQQAAISELNKFSENQKHNVLISGSKQCGKTYLAHFYAKLLGIDDFQIVDSKMSAIKDVMDTCGSLDTTIVLCIENLDLGVNAVSYAILKFLEEPAENVYIVITCRNVKKIPDTILSRCVTISVPPIINSDLVSYAKTSNLEQYSKFQNMEIFWKCVKSMNDVDALLSLGSVELEYIKSLPGLVSSKEPVSNLIWKLQKFPSGAMTPIEIIIRYLMYSISSAKIFNACYNCLNALDDSRVGNHAILAKLAFELKYSGE